jgi:hypothetical protein
MARQLLRPRLKRYMHRRPDKDPNPWLSSGALTVTGRQLSLAPTLGSELLTDPGLEAWTSATNATSYTEIVGGTSTVNKEATIFHGGSFSARLDVDSSGTNVGISQAITAAAGTWLRVNLWAYASATGKKPEYFEGASVANFDPGAAWTNYDVSYKASAANPTPQFHRLAGSSASSSLYFDDLSIKALTLNTLFAVKAGIANPNSVGASGTILANNICGVVYGLDSYTAPANFILALHNGVGTVSMLKCISGTYTTLISTAVTYVAGVIPLIKYTGSNTYQLWYNGVQRGADQTITGMTGIYHGIFSTHPGNVINGFWVG